MDQARQGNLDEIGSPPFSRDGGKTSTKFLRQPSQGRNQYQMVYRSTLPLALATSNIRKHSRRRKFSLSIPNELVTSFFELKLFHYPLFALDAQAMTYFRLLLPDIVHDLLRDRPPNPIYRVAVPDMPTMVRRTPTTQDKHDFLLSLEDSLPISAHIMSRIRRQSVLQSRRTTLRCCILITYIPTNADRSDTT